MQQHDASQSALHKGAYRGRESGGKLLEGSTVLVAARGDHLDGHITAKVCGPLNECSVVLHRHTHTNNILPAVSYSGGCVVVVVVCTEPR